MDIRSFPVFLPFCVTSSCLHQRPEDAESDRQQLQVSICLYFKNWLKMQKYSDIKILSLLSAIDILVFQSGFVEFSFPQDIDRKKIYLQLLKLF